MDNLYTKKNQYEVIPLILDIIVKTINPVKIVLFGSCARKCITQNSDIDICIVLGNAIKAKERMEIRNELLKRLLDVIDFEVDIFICSKDEWEKNYRDRGTIIGKINNEGEMIYG